MMRLLFFPLFFFLFSQQSLATSIEVDTDTEDCIDGHISMDVVVRVGSERFTFDPSCNFSFREEFKTSDGINCRIEAGMCSSFSPKNKIEVSCEGTSDKVVSVSCPIKTK